MCRKFDEKRLNKFSNPDFEPYQVHHFLTNFSLVYIPEKVFTNGLKICKLIVDRSIFGYRICKIVINYKQFFFL